RAHQQFWVA
ncbi:hypothetical protein D049_4450B, partial [Vibrio parahaemolyticus VPTS-2010]